MVWAGAVLVSNDAVAAEFVGGHTVSEDFFDMWRSDRDTFVRSYEERFIREKGYTRMVPEAVNLYARKVTLGWYPRRLTQR